ncbi:MAG: hypothetical protein KAR44_01765 [Candidatus Aegiribacteria sp.]|nr:hypothetical protein [Candidatus Aegiribacteria sp.]
MKSKKDTGRIAARLTTAVSSMENPEGRIEALAKFISGYKPDEIGHVLGSVIVDACQRIEASLTFLSLIDRPLLKKSSPDWDWGALDDWFSKTKLEEVWTLYNHIPSVSSKHVIAKISLLIEIIFVLIEDDLLDPESDMDCSGADIALTILKGAGKEDPIFKLSLTSFPVEIRKFVKDILAEFDFIENTPGIWQFTFSQTGLDNFASGNNLRIHMGSSQMSMAVAQRNAENLVKRLELLVKALQMFPSGHPSIDPSTESFLTILSKFYKEKEQVTLSVMGDTVMVNEISVERKTTSMSSFVRAFIERKMSSLTFDPGVTAEDVKTFAKIFNRPPAYISEHGGMDRLLELRGLSSIFINRFHYQLISEGGDTDQTLARGEVTIEDAIFSELIDRLERGESIDSLPGSKIGDALKSVLAAAKENREEQRGMIARFVFALDPTLLEKGLLSNRVIQRGMAWKAVRKIIDRLLASLPSPDPDTRHRAVGKLQDMALLAVERGKENSTIQIIEYVSRLIKREQDPDVLYRGVVLTASLMEALLARGMMTIALQAGKILQNLEAMRFSRTELEAARKRSLGEAQRKMDTINAAEALVQNILSDDEIVSREATNLAMIIPPDNLVSQLVNIFHEDSRRLRSKAFRMLLKMGKRGLTAIHERLTEIVTAFNSKVGGGTYLLPDIEWYMARNMIQVLRDLGSPSSESILAELCKVPDSRIRRECLLALTQVSSTTAESLSMYLIIDKSKEVAEIALDILTKQAMMNPAFVPSITEAFRKNSDIRTEIMESFSMLGNQAPVIAFLSRNLQDGPSSILFEDQNLVSGAFRIISRYGGTAELPVLQNLLDEVEGGFFRKHKIEKYLVQQLKETIEKLTLSENVIESNVSPELPSDRPRKPRKPRKPPEDDEITILGPNYGIDN